MIAGDTKNAAMDEATPAADTNATAVARRIVVAVGFRVTNRTLFASKTVADAPLELSEFIQKSYKRVQTDSWSNNCFNRHFQLAVCTHTHIYIYIYRERERLRDIFSFLFSCSRTIRFFSRESSDTTRNAKT